MPNRTEVTWQKPSRISTGRLPLLRLFSTLLAITLIDPGNCPDGKCPRM